MLNFINTQPFTLKLRFRALQTGWIRHSKNFHLKLKLDEKPPKLQVQVPCDVWWLFYSTKRLLAFLHKKVFRYVKLTLLFRGPIHLF